MLTGSNASADVFPFRPWVRRAGLSILLVAASLTLLVAAGRWRGGAWGWASEPVVHLYLIAVWAAALKITVTTFRPVAELRVDGIVLRPIHQLRRRTVAWNSVRGTEQMIGGDRLIVYYDAPRGLRFVALNLNLVRGRRNFLELLEAKLGALGFEERVVERSRYLTRVG